MSDRLNHTKSESNEEIIDDLTKSFKNALESGKNTNNKIDEFVIERDNDEGTASSAGKPCKDEMPHDIERDFDDDEDEEDQRNHNNKNDNMNEEDDADSIDETQLKDAEMDLTDDQKAERKIIAEELKVAGNNAFKVGEYERSAEKYTEGLKICPLQFSQQRAILYCNRSAAKMKMEKYKHAIKDCTKAIELDDKYLKAYIRRAQSYEATEKLDESLADYKKILELDPSHKEARAAEVRLPPLIEEKNEKLKQEMMGKLKDLGNMILKPFGLSTANFQLEQDPETKGYKINFKQ
ncbi:unnamed protein product [Diatraea saccharalis]|uniref:Tetratricopeptide repeat protein 1 n=1 Tax=Diatraea saccharalis TaxID=40085 RepID=A0A9N9WFL6_9NEOP|nr:unnamed protein product [Diatraea saccharalis]